MHLLTSYMQSCPILIILQLMNMTNRTTTYKKCFYKDSKRKISLSQCLTTLARRSRLRTIATNASSMKLSKRKWTTRRKSTLKSRTSANKVLSKSNKNLNRNAFNSCMNQKNVLKILKTSKTTRASIPNET